MLQAADRKRRFRPMYGRCRDGYGGVAERGGIPTPFHKHKVATAYMSPLCMVHASSLYVAASRMPSCRSRCRDDGDTLIVLLRS